MWLGAAVQVREITEQVTGKTDFRFQAQAILCLQEASEAFLVLLFEDAYELFMAGLFEASSRAA